MTLYGWTSLESEATSRLIKLDAVSEAVAMVNSVYLSEVTVSCRSGRWFQDFTDARLCLGRELQKALEWRKRCAFRARKLTKKALLVDEQGL